MNKDEVVIQEALANGQKELAFRMIVRMSSRSLYGVIRRMVGDHMLADDMLQNVYMKVFQKIGTFRWKSSLSTWMYRIAVNEVLGMKRSEERHLSVVLDGQEAREDVYVDFEKWENHLEAAVNDLPQQQRLVFILKYFEDKTYKEIAEMMDRSEGGLKANYHHAVGKVKAYIESKM